MPQTASPPERTFDLIDADIRAATAERDRLYANCKDRKIPLRTSMPSGIAWADNVTDGDGIEWHHINSGIGEDTPRIGLAASRAWLAAWEAQRGLEDLQLERLLLSIERWKDMSLPSEADISGLSEQVTTAKRDFENLRGQLFRSREAVRGHAARGIELRRMLADARAELARTDGKVASHQGMVERFERAVEGQRDLNEGAQEARPLSEDELLFIRETA